MLSNEECPVVSRSFTIFVTFTDLYELIPHINISENAIQFLQDRGILRSVPPLCTHSLCVKEMTEVNMGRRRGMNLYEISTKYEFISTQF